MRDAEAVTFAGGSLDRAAHLRSDPDAQAELARLPGARCLAFWSEKPLLDVSQGARLCWLPPGHDVFAPAAEAPIFLGLRDADTPLFARAIPDWQPSDTATGPAPFLDQTRARHPALPDAIGFGDLRAQMAQLSPRDAGDAATAKGILGWHATHGFCARCGARSQISEGGWRRTCTDCGAHHFPRTDPVVIMLILSGNSVLLGRAAFWPEGMYSLLAGFMEPGESIEAAVRRETLEETAIRIGQVDYLASQPWPFPSSLMIGCRGAALTREIHRDPVELQDALWVTREEVLAAMDGSNPALRPARQGSIARFLLERWLSDTLG